MASTISAGRFRAISTAVTAGTTSSHGVRLNVPFSASEYASICAAGTPSCESPSTAKMTRAMQMDGTVVTIIYLMCVNRGTRFTDEAMTVVSDSGEILSPK